MSVDVKLINCIVNPDIMIVNAIKCRVCYIYLIVISKINKLFHAGHILLLKIYFHLRAIFYRICHR